MGEGREGKGKAGGGVGKEDLNFSSKMFNFLQVWCPASAFKYSTSASKCSISAFKYSIFDISLQTLSFRSMYGCAARLEPYQHTGLW